MDMNGEYPIAAPRRKVWEALNDPEILKLCIPGCEAIEKISETEFTAIVVAKVGPVKAKFTGAVTLRDIDPPNGYTIAGEGKGGAAGFASGKAQVKLSDYDGGDAGDGGESAGGNAGGSAGGTMLRYSVTAQVGGKLAQIGSRLIDSTAKKLAGEFFTTFGDTVAGTVSGTISGTAPGTATSAQQGEATMTDKPDSTTDENVYPKTHWTIWLTGALALAALVYFATYLDFTFG